MMMNIALARYAAELREALDQRNDPINRPLPKVRGAYALQEFAASHLGPILDEYGTRLHGQGFSMQPYDTCYGEEEFVLDYKVLFNRKPVMKFFLQADPTHYLTATFMSDTDMCGFRLALQEVEDYLLPQLLVKAARMLPNGIPERN